MNGISDWFQNNWIDLARLLVQCAILAVIVRYGRKVLATLRASQEQVGALLKLSVSDSVEERQAPTAEPAPQFDARREAIPEPEPEPEPEPVFAGAMSRSSYDAEREHTLGGRVIGSQTPAFSAPAFSAPVFSSPASQTASPSLTPWVSAPATEPERLNVPLASAAARPSASSWLQAPMRRSGGSPWRKMLRWLQAPAGH